MISNEYQLIEIHWISMYVRGDDATYLDSFGVECFPEEIEKVNQKEKYQHKYL